MATLLLHLRHRRTGPDQDWVPARDTPNSLADFCCERTPDWTRTRDGVYLDLTGTGRLHGLGHDGLIRICEEAKERLGIEVGGAGPNRLVAGLASRVALSWGPGHLLTVPHGAARTFLAGFSLTAISVSPLLRERLRRLGVHTLGDLQVVPGSLLRAALGQAGVRLAAQAAGLARPGPAGQSRPEMRPLWRVGFTCRRPLSSPTLLAAARHGLAIRALAGFPAGPGGATWWGLQARWQDNRTFLARLPGFGDGTWPVWRRFVHRLWGRLPERRSGPVHLELAAEGTLKSGLRQINLFPDDAAAIRLAGVVRDLHGLAPGLLVPASEGLLRDWGARWFQTACQVDGDHDDE